jgi:hypothetical protein
MTPLFLLLISVFLAGCKTTGSTDKRQGPNLQQQKPGATSMPQQKTPQTIPKLMFPNAQERTPSVDYIAF